MAGSDQMLFMMQSCMPTHIQSVDLLISGAIFSSTMQTVNAARGPFRICAFSLRQQR